MKKSVLIGVIAIIILSIFFYPKPYMSSPGFVTPEVAQLFNSTAKHCFGFSQLTNSGEVAVDGPGKSLCYGWLY